MWVFGSPSLPNNLASRNGVSATVWLASQSSVGAITGFFPELAHPVFMRSAELIADPCPSINNTASSGTDFRAGLPPVDTNTPCCQYAVGVQITHRLAPLATYFAMVCDVVWSGCKNGQ